jgi:hypothetical protein
MIVELWITAVHHLDSSSDTELTELLLFKYRVQYQKKCAELKEVLSLLKSGRFSFAEFYDYL